MRLRASASRLTALLALSLLLPAHAAPGNAASVPFPRVEPEEVGMSSQHLQKASHAVKDLVEQREYRPSAAGLWLPGCACRCVGWAVVGWPRGQTTLQGRKDRGLPTGSGLAQMQRVRAPIRSTEPTRHSPHPWCIHPKPPNPQAGWPAPPSRCCGTGSWWHSRHLGGWDDDGEVVISCGM